MKLRDRKQPPTPTKPSPKPKASPSPRKRKQVATDEDHRSPKGKKSRKVEAAAVEAESIDSETNDALPKSDVEVEPATPVPEALPVPEVPAEALPLPEVLPPQPPQTATSSSNNTPRRIHRSFSRACDSVEDDYVLEDQLGTGSFAVVRKARHRATGQRFAVKMIEATIFERNRGSTEQEIEVLSKLNHQNIVKLHEVIRTPSHLCIVMELCLGGELFDRIVSKDKYNENDAKHLTKTILEGVKYLHSNGIVHRDMKPENLIFDRPGDHATLKITDFGLAALYTDQQKLTKFCGTPEYLAPEIVNKQPYDAQVDMWSVGVIAYILLSGYPPFYGDNNQEIFDMIRKGRFTYIQPFFDAVSPTAKQFIDALLVMDPHKRMNVDQALAHPWLASVTAEAPDLSSTLSELSRFNAVRRFRRIVLAVIAMNHIKAATKLIQESQAHSQSQHLV